MTNTAEPLDDFTAGLLSDFLDESTGLLSRLSENLLELDQWSKGAHARDDRPTDLLNDMFRSAHSIKGLSGMLRLNDINLLTHKVENVFDAARNGELPVCGETVDVIFQAVDSLSELIDALKASESEQVECGAVLEKIEALLKRYNSARAISTQAEVEADLAALHAAHSTEASAVKTVAPDPLVGIVDDTDIPAKYLGIFIDEAGLTLEELSESLLAQPGPAGVEPLLVGCHRIKGSAASIGLHRVAKLSHGMEDLLQELRRRRAAPTTQEADVLLRCVDSLRGYVASLSVGSREADTLGESCRALAQLTCSAAASATPEAPPAAASFEEFTGEWEQAKAGAPPATIGVVGQVLFEPGLTLAELKARVLISKLCGFGTLHYCRPSEEELDHATTCDHLTFGLTTDAATERVRREMFIEGVAAVRVMATNESRPAARLVAETQSQAAGNARPVAPPETTGPEAAKSANDSKSKPTETLRVDIERLDQLMNLAGQLVINRARFGQIADQLKGLSSFRTISQSLSGAQLCAARIGMELQASPAAAKIAVREELCGLTTKLQDDLDALQRDIAQLSRVRNVLGELSEAVHQLERVSDGIQSTVMDTRMVPIGPLFTRFKRAVRDLTRDNHKDIRLEILGENTELDKRMIDELGDPLIHLVRNSADHGIETPEAREAAGKPRQGTITLNAYHRGNRIVIDVCDDGKGLDADKIRAKALSRGLITEADAEKMTPQQFYELIWRPGFSTAEKITEVSGRGMGMDIVWSKIEQLSGTVELTSVPGKGTTFSIKLPLTMAILPSLMAVIEGDVFAIPVESVAEIVRFDAKDVQTVHGKPSLRVRGRVISLTELHDIFGGEDRPAAAARDVLTVVIVNIAGREIGIVVDHLLGEQDVVIQSLAENFRNVEGVAGASILGDGRVSLILDIGTLLDMACRPPHDAAALCHEHEPAEVAQGA
ncbi:MAG: Hpt domain-containing protein [Planctomycetaceae bacterium]|nr:Hpt domain-containing protein [Planctomycetaceae bacterium]